MTKTNATLLEDNNRRRKDASKLKSELKLQQQSHGEQLNQMKADFDIALAHRDLELKNLQTSCLSTIALHRREVQMIQEEAERKREEHSTEISRLRDEIKRTQVMHAMGRIILALFMTNSLCLSQLPTSTGLSSRLLGEAYGCLGDYPTEPTS
jgi:hypothetical protein